MQTPQIGSHLAARLAVAEKNLIPQMTHPLSRSWPQPDTKWIVVDDESALMPQEAFDKLADYTHSEPTAVYAGKMWRTRNRDGSWWLHWWGPSKEPDCVSHNCRRILVA